LKHQNSKRLTTYDQFERRARSQFGSSARRAGVWVLPALAALFILTGTARAESLNIEGTYNIYVVDKVADEVWTTMTIYDQKDANFSIKGDGWTGHGTIMWMSGSYEWKLASGKSGRTTFAVRADGTIDGQVTGVGREFNWDYIARRQGKAETPTTAPNQPQATVEKITCKECDTKRDTELAACEHKATPGEELTCSNDATTRWVLALDHCVK